MITLELLTEKNIDAVAGQIDNLTQQTGIEPALLGAIVLNFDGAA